MKRKLAIFDVDGTLFDGTTGIELIKEMIENDLINKQIAEKIFGLFRKYQSGEMEKSKAADLIYQLAGKGFKGKSVHEIDRVANRLWEKISCRVFDFAPRVVELLNSKHFLIILMSGSSIEIISKLSKELGIPRNNVIAGLLESKDGLYTGKVNSYMGSAKDKINAVQKLLLSRKIEPEWENSLGIGNDERDIGILSTVGCPFVFEPSKILLEIAEKNNWPIVNRKNANELIEEQVNNIK